MFSNLASKVSEQASKVSVLVAEKSEKVILAVNERKTCEGCEKKILNTKIVSNIESYEGCYVCEKMFCAECIITPRLEIPIDMIHHSFLTESSKENILKNQRICKKKCLPYVTLKYMSIFREDITIKIDPIIQKYIEQNIHINERPTQNAEDGNDKKALRVYRMVEVVGTKIGLSTYLTAIKFAFYGKEIYSRLMTGDIFQAWGPVIEGLSALGGINASDYKSIVYLYYQSEKHVLETKSNIIIEHSKNEEICPHSMIDYLANFIAPASWLYNCVLREPHDTLEWSSWYLQKLIYPHGWKVLFCMNETTKLPDGSKCPAFALVARTNGIGGLTNGKEALLVIRGSVSIMDWGINLKENPMSYTYYGGVNGDNLIEGHVHCGMYEGAVRILDGYVMRKYVTKLIDQGYDMKIVGHSLGI
jgi:hypothetical protein